MVYWRNKLLFGMQREMLAKHVIITKTAVYNFYINCVAFKEIATSPTQYIFFLIFYTLL